MQELCYQRSQDFQTHNELHLYQSQRNSINKVCGIEGHVLESSQDPSANKAIPGPLTHSQPERGLQRDAKSPKRIKTLQY